MEYKVTPLGKGLTALLIFALGYGVYLALVPRADPLAKPPRQAASQGLSPAMSESDISGVASGAQDQSSGVPTPPAAVDAAASPAAVATSALNVTSPPEPVKTDPAAKAAIEACARMATDYRLTIYYAPHSSEIGQEFLSELKEFADNANLLGDYRVQIEGSCAVMPGQKVSTKQQAYYQALSEKRAQEVAVYLRSHGVAADMLDVRGNGIAKQIGDNSSSQLRFHNRRTDIFLLPVP